MTSSPSLFSVRPIAVHEAAHALARWLFGLTTFSAAVWRENGRTLGCVSGPGIALDMAIESKEERIVAEIALVVLLIGPAAQAKYSKKSQAAVVLSGGVSDYETARGIARAWFSDASSALDVAERRASAILASQNAWLAILQVADALETKGGVSGDAIFEICAARYGWFSALDDWVSAWPPDDRHLKQGLLPWDGRTDGFRPWPDVAADSPGLICPKLLGLVFTSGVSDEHA